MPEEAAYEHLIREKAYYFWEEDGRPAGRAAEHWTRAEAAVRIPETTDIAEAPPKRKAAAKPKKK